MDITKLLIANNEFGQKRDGVFNGLAANGGLNQDAIATVAGMASAWSAIMNATLQDIATQFAVKDLQLREQQEEIKKIFEKQMEDKVKPNNSKEDIWKVVNEKNGEKHLPDKWEGKSSKIHFREIRDKMHNWADAVYSSGVDIMKWIEDHDAPMKAMDLKKIWEDNELDKEECDVVKAANELQAFDTILY